MIVDEPRKIPKEVQSIFEGMESIITFKKQNNLSLTKYEAIYLSAKSKEFKEIKDLESWSYWLLTGVPYKSTNTDTGEIAL
ncbi:hypothetical protein [uncultured Bacteroides sp.]|uniref:hypothetical protein n=1 Tax=uncultured Bacteroides sp. TaxID=162156 RepID=UPI002AA60555|nr:hypothetical protein [uncultured Bacteroides sp.]